MHYWEFMLYLEGYKETFYNEQMNIMKLSYYTGMFSKETKSRPKSLNYYLKQIDKAFNKDKGVEKPVDVKKSWEIYHKIEELKRWRKEK